jgi:hypothetical protein
LSAGDIDSGGGAVAVLPHDGGIKSSFYAAEPVSFTGNAVKYKPGFGARPANGERSMYMFAAKHFKWCAHKNADQQLIMPG